MPWWRRLFTPPPHMHDDKVVATLVIGLGNPGEEYASTRHNVGRMVVETFANRYDQKWKATKHHARVVSLQLTPGSTTVPADRPDSPVAGRSVVLGVPLSYMNLSGGPTAALAGFYSVPRESVIVVHDELDLPFGTVRIKSGGGSGGHNGLKDVTKALGGPEYLRIRVGIGRPPGRMEPGAFVLKPFSKEEKQSLPEVCETAVDAVETLVLDGLQAAQQRFHIS